jgi:hypothetical protein
MLNEFSVGEKIVMPKPVLRTISLEKLRNPSPMTEKTASKPVHYSDALK